MIPTNTTDRRDDEVLRRPLVQLDRSLAPGSADAAPGWRGLDGGRLRLRRRAQRRRPPVGPSGSAVIVAAFASSSSSSDRPGRPRLTRRARVQALVPARAPAPAQVLPQLGIRAQARRWSPAAASRRLGLGGLVGVGGRLLRRAVGSVGHSVVSLLAAASVTGAARAPVYRRRRAAVRRSLSGHPAHSCETARPGPATQRSGQSSPTVTLDRHGPDDPPDYRRVTRRGPPAPAARRGPPRPSPARRQPSPAPARTSCAEHRPQQHRDRHRPEHQREAEADDPAHQLGRRPFLEQRLARDDEDHVCHALPERQPEGDGQVARSTRGGRSGGPTARSPTITIRPIANRAPISPIANPPTRLPSADPGLEEAVEPPASRGRSC